MSTYEERRVDAIQKKLKARTKPNGEARPGYEQNVAQLRASLDVILGVENK